MYCIVCIVQCIVHCTVYIVQCTLHSFVNSLNMNVTDNKCTINIINSTEYIMYYRIRYIYTIQWIVYGIYYIQWASEFYTVVKYNYTVVSKCVLYSGQVYCVQG